MDDLSLRMRRVISVRDPLKDLTDLVSSGNKFHISENPEGIINLGAAQNRLLGDVMHNKMQQVDVSQFDASFLFYQDERGMPAFRAAIADFLTRITGSPQRLDPDKIQVTCGVNSLLEIIPYILCDEGDTILVPAPMYGGIMKALSRRPNVKVCAIHVSSKPGAEGEEPFQLTVEQLERSYTEAKEQGSRVKALLLTNPHNPFGTVYTREQVMAYLQFCKKYHLHAISDEIYLASIFDHTTPMSSLLTTSEEDLPDPQRTHFLYSFGKDFSCTGFACGMIYSWNEIVLRAVKELTFHHPPSSLVQSALTQMLQDKEWMHEVFLPTSHHRLREACDIVVAMLNQLGVTYIRPKAGLFVWANLSKFMHEATVEEEAALCRHLITSGVFILPSSGFYGNEQGWFRILFSVPLAELRKGVERLRQGCLSYVPAAQDQPCQAAPLLGDEIEILQVSSDSGESLESLFRLLRVNMRASDWLETNTAEKWSQENPEAYRAWMKELNKTEQSGLLDEQEPRE